MALKVLITTIDTNNAAKSFGIVGSILLDANDIKRNIAKPANDDAIQYQKPELNSIKLVAIINQLSIMDNLLSHKLNNEKLAYENSKLDEQEARIERGKQLQNFKDAEKVQTSSATGLGLLGLAGLGLLAYDPIMGFIKGIADFAEDAGKFISDTVKEITSFFENFLPDAPVDNPIDSPIKQGSSLREKAEAAPSYAPPPPSADAKPVATPPPPKGPSLREQAEIAVVKKPGVTQSVDNSNSQLKDNRSWWERNAPSWAGGKSAPTPAAESNSKQAPTPAAESNSKQTEDPSQYMDFRSPSGTRERFELLNSDVKKALFAAAKEYYETYNEKLGIESAVRTNADQKRLWDMSVKQGHPGKIRWPSGKILPVAKPGTSPHEKKNAVDIVQWSKAKSILNKHGLFQTVPGDAPHYSLGAAAAQVITENPQQSTVEKVTAKATEVVDNTLNSMAEFIGKVGGKIVGPGVARNLTTASPDFAKLISNEAATQTAEIAKIKDDASKPKPAPVVSPPNISAAGSPIVQNLPTMVDRNSIEYYLRRFGYKETNTPIKVA